MKTRLNIKVIPGSSQNQIIGWLDEILKVKVKAPAENSKANQAILLLLSNCLEIDKQDLTLVSGLTNQYKTIEINNLNKNDMLDKIYWHLNR